MCCYVTQLFVNTHTHIHLYILLQTILLYLLVYLFYFRYKFLYVLKLLILTFSTVELRNIYKNCILCWKFNIVNPFLIGAKFPDRKLARTLAVKMGPQLKTSEMCVKEKYVS